MWLRLTNQKGEEIIVDASKVSDIIPVPNGTRLSFMSVAEDKDGKNKARSVVAKETVQQIAKALNATTVR